MVVRRWCVCHSMTATSYVTPLWPRRRLSPGANCIALASTPSAASLPCAPSSAAASSLLLLLPLPPPPPWPLCPLAPPGGVSGCTPQAWAGAEGCAGTAACAAAAGGSVGPAGQADVQAGNVSSGQGQPVLNRGRQCGARCKTSPNVQAGCTPCGGGIVVCKGRAVGSGMGFDGSTAA